MIINPAIKYIDSDVNIWVVHGGKSKRRLEDFELSSKIFLDMPGLNIGPDFDIDSPSLYANIAMTDAIAKFHRDNAAYLNALGRWEAHKAEDPNYARPRPSPPSEPSRDSQNYFVRDADQKIYASRKLAIDHFINGIKLGDIVIVPGYDFYTPFLAGFVTSDANPEARLTLEGYGDDFFLARQVSWISHGCSKRSLTPKLAKKLTTRRAVSLVYLDGLEGELFAALFGSYSYKDSAGFDIDCPKYRGKNPTETIPLQELLAFFVGYWDAIQNEPESLPDLDFYRVVNEYYDEVYLKDISLEFHSPGFYRSLFTSKTAMLFCLVGISVALQADSTNGDSLTQQITIDQRDVPEDVDVDQVSEAVGSLIRYMTPDMKEQIQKHARRAADMRATTSATRASRGVKNDSNVPSNGEAAD